MRDCRCFDATVGWANRAMDSPKSTSNFRRERTDLNRVLSVAMPGVSTRFVGRLQGALFLSALGIEAVLFGFHLCGQRAVPISFGLFQRRRGGEIRLGVRIGRERMMPGPQKKRSAFERRRIPV